MKAYGEPNRSRYLSRWLELGRLLLVFFCFVSYNTLAQKRDRSNQTDSRKTKKNKRSNRTKEVKVGNPRIITGKVTDDTGEGLPGVNVVRKGQ